MNVRQATRSYEAWMRRQIAVNERDLRLKRERMAESPFLFLRATFYRWIQRWPEVCPSLATAPPVVAIGDLHVENFGTWRDAEGRLVWGVNDVDEACTLPYTQDLVRLATSAVLAIHAGHFALPPREACEAVLDGYQSSLKQGGRPFVLAERRRWLRTLALNDLRDPAVFWPNLQRCRAAGDGAPLGVLRRHLPKGATVCRIVERVAGAGSLGRPRFVALANWGGGLVAREAKAILPSAATWADPGCPRVNAASLLAGAVRVGDPCFDIAYGWIVRRLAPDCCRIELAELPRRRDEARLLRAMGWETANLHLASRNRRVERDLRERPKRWLARAAADMADATVDDFHELSAP
jgi:uncharacterized protein DUF2252